jgi:hypothetical protein
MPQAFAAVLLVCLGAVPREACTEDTAADVRSIVVDNELGCAVGWQELIARAAPEERAGADGSTYLKTICRRVRPGERR